MKYRIAAYITVFIFTFGFYYYGRSYWYPYYLKFKGKRTVSDVIEKYGSTAEKRFLPNFEKANIPYPPKKLILFALKEQNIMELWASNQNKYKLIKEYKIKAASGKLGPKLREGDRQVPEGIYKIVGLNPNSSYHLSMKLNYPNRFDLRYAKKEGRNNPGSNIFIHGNAVSIGCLAMGDAAIEELFTMVYKVGKSNVEVIISPSDTRTKKLVPPARSPEWVSELYLLIQERTSVLSKT
jgi:murein L,D-transpeptidase YafK